MIYYILSGFAVFSANLERIKILETADIVVVAMMWGIAVVMFGMGLDSSIKNR